MTLRIYTASSWQNPHYSSIVEAIKLAGFEVYDFRNPWNKGAAFNWDEIDPSWESWTSEEFIRALEHPIARRGFESDRAGMYWADLCVLILPCGRSSHMEAGWFLGKGKPVHILLYGASRPELTYIWATKLHSSVESLLEGLRALSK